MKTDDDDDRILDVDAVEAATLPYCLACDEDDDDYDGVQVTRQSFRRECAALNSIRSKQR